MIHVSDSSVRSRDNDRIERAVFILMKRTCFALFASAVVLSSLSAMAAEGARGDHDEAREAVERHDIRPLDEILARLRDKTPGEIVKVALKREHGGWLYEFRLVDRKGRVREIAVDAATGALKNAGED
jgi:uncharacterized membrane protein YkoI